MTYGEEKQHLSNLTIQIAAAMGAPWRAVPPKDFEGPTDDIANGNGASLYLRLKYNAKDRISIGGSMHFEVNGRLQNVNLYPRFEVPNISVAIERGPEAIAKEIKRRLLPDYLKAVELAKAQVAKENATTAKRQANIRTLVALSPGARMPEFDRYPDADRFYLDRGQVCVHYDGSVTFERLGCSMEEAESILRYLRDQRKGGEA